MTKRIISMLQIRYHPKFKASQDTLLFAGTGDDLNILRRFFTQWNGEELDLIQHFKAQEKVYLSSVTELQLRRDDEQNDLTWHGSKGTWAVSRKHQNVIVGL